MYIRGLLVIIPNIQIFKEVITMTKLFKKLFTRKPTTDNFFGENDVKENTIIGVFKEWSYTNHYYTEYEFTKEEKIFVGAWIATAKSRNHEYNVIYF